MTKIRRTALLPVAAVLAITGCTSGEEPAAAPSTLATSSSSIPPAASAPASPTQEATPEQQFLTAMDEAGIVPKLSNAADAINLATAICVAYGSGESFTEVMATLAGGSLSLDQMIDLNQAATQFYCPRFYVPEP